MTNLPNWIHRLCRECRGAGSAWGTGVPGLLDQQPLLCPRTLQHIASLQASLPSADLSTDILADLSNFLQLIPDALGRARSETESTDILSVVTDTVVMTLGSVCPRHRK